MLSISLKNVDASDETINIITILCGSPSFTHNIGDMIFSIISNNNNATLERINLTIYCDNYADQYLNRCIDKLNSRLKINKVSINSLRIYDKFIDIENKDVRFRCAIHKLSLVDLYANISQLLYIDADTLVFEDILPLWNSISNNKEKLIIGALENGNNTNQWYVKHKKYHYFPPSGINTGVLLFNLDNIRNINLTAETLYLANSEEILLADQDVLNSWAYYNKDKVGLFDCKWNKRVGDSCNGIETNKGIFHGSDGVLHKKYWHLSDPYKQQFIHFCGY